MVSFSSGRTSGLMLRRILDAGLQPDVHILFANTGKERPESLDFAHEVERRWGCRIHWLEHRRASMDEPAQAAEVDYATASRAGEPFKQLLAARGFLPNPTSRFCTQELKIRVMARWMRDRGYEHWTNVVGFRADEPRRVARARAADLAGKERWDRCFPLYDAGIVKGDVMAFWRAQQFDLQLRTWEGNCDLCFLKGQAKRLRIMRDRPDLADWWIEAEAEARASKPDGAVFRIDAPSYRRLRVISEQPFLPFDPADLDGTSIDDRAIAHAPTSPPRPYPAALDHEAGGPVLPRRSPPAAQGSGRPLGHPLRGWRRGCWMRHHRPPGAPADGR